MLAKSTKCFIRALVPVHRSIWWNVDDVLNKLVLEAACVLTAAQPEPQDGPECHDALSGVTRVCPLPILQCTLA